MTEAHTEEITQTLTKIVEPIEEKPIEQKKVQDKINCIDCNLEVNTKNFSRHKKTKGHQIAVGQLLFGSPAKKLGISLHQTAVGKTLTPKQLIKDSVFIKNEKPRRKQKESNHSNSETDSESEESTLETCYPYQQLLKIIADNQARVDEGSALAKMYREKFYTQQLHKNINNK